MNPLLIARNLRQEYLRLLKTTFRPRQQELRESFDAEIERDGFSTREPSWRWPSRTNRPPR